MVVFFFTKNSSVVFVFSFRKTFPASLKPPQEFKIKRVKATNVIFFIYLFFKNSFVKKIIIPKVINMSATLNVNQ